jgi:hypothetical protein
MRVAQYRVAIVFPADPLQLSATRVEQSRLKEVARALTSAGAEVVSAPFCDEIASEIEARLVEVDFVLVWYNPFEGGRDRSRLNAMLRALAARGVGVSGHPDVIDKMGTKDVLFQTRHLSWGTDVRRYDSLDAMRAQLPVALRAGPRVLKQMRGQSGDGVWKVSVTNASPSLQVAVRHATRDSVEEIMLLDDFLRSCRPYFEQFGAMIDQPFQPRIHEGMIRCYVVGDRVAGFGEQLINALYPAPEGRPQTEAPQPGPRLYFPADRADFQPLKRNLESEWIAQMCAELAISRDALPALWDADFMFGEKTSAGEDTFVLCEINMSSVYPFPPSAMGPLVEEVLRRCEAQSESR